MKTASLIAFFFLITGNFIYAQDSNSILEKKIDLNVKDYKIDSILKHIEQKINFKIGYSGSIIDTTKTVSISVKNKTIREIFNDLFAPDTLEYKVMNNHVLIFKKKDKSKKKYTLSGYIKEIGSEEHLVGASIYIPELQVGTTTNDYGFYSLTIPEGTYEIYLTYLGYSPVVKQIGLKSDTKLTFEMQVTTENLEEVVISAEEKKYESKVTQMSSIRVIPSIIQDVPTLLGEKDVLKTIQLLPGIQQGTEGSVGFYVRGGSPDQNLIILDDAPVYNVNHLLGIFSVFNGDAIKSVEVFKGGFPARFGGRLSSVLKINMKDGNKEEFSGKASIGLISSSLLLEGPIKKGKTSFLFSGRRTYADLIVKPFLQDDHTVGYHFTDLNLKFHHVFNEKNKLFWSNYFGEDKFDEKGYYFMSIEDGYSSPYENKIGWSNITSTLRWNHEFNQKLFSNTSFIFSKYSLKSMQKEGYANGSYVFTSNSGINDLSAKIDFDYFPNSKHAIKFGVAGTSHSFTPQNLLIRESEIEDVNKKQVLNSIESAVYLEDDWKITDKLNISPGIRFSHYKYKSEQYFNAEPRLGVAYKLKPDLAFKVSYSKMNQYIHLLTSSGIGLPTDIWVSTTKKVKPQKSEQIAFGVAKDFVNSGYSLSVEGYYKSLKNVLAYKGGDSFLSFEDIDAKESWETNLTSGRGWAYGTEILFRKEKGLLTGWFGYTLSWSQRQFEELNLGRKFNDKFDRRHNISCVVIYKPNKKISLSGSWVFSSGANYTLPDSRALTTIDNFPISVFKGSNVMPTNKNNFKGENTHRLDLGIQFHKETKRGNERTWSFSLYNVYARKNPIYYTTRHMSYREVVKTSVMIIPSINYTKTF